MSDRNDLPATIRAHVDGQLPMMVDNIGKTLIAKYPKLSPARAYEIAGAYVLQDWNSDVDLLTDTELDVILDLDLPSARGTIIDHSNNRGILIDLHDLMTGNLDFTL